MRCLCKVLLCPVVCLAIVASQANAEPIISGGTTPYAWYRADVGVTKYDGSDQVETWVDQSGNGRDITSIDAAQAPTLTTNGIGGRSALTFDGNDQLIGSHLTAGWGQAQPGTVFAVWQLTNVGGASDYAYLYDCEKTDEPMQREALSFDPTFRIQGRKDPDTLYAELSGVVGIGDWVVSSASHLGTNDTVRLNGEQAWTGNLESGGMDGLRVGCFLAGTRNYWYGEVCEVAFFEGTMSSSERAQIEDVMAQRWAVPEPSTLVLLAIGGMMMLMFTRRKAAQ